MAESIKEKLNNKLNNINDEIKLLETMKDNIPKVKRFKLFNKKTISLLMEDFPLTHFVNYKGETVFYETFSIIKSDYHYGVGKRFKLYKTKEVIFNFDCEEGIHVDWKKFESEVESSITYYKNRRLLYEKQAITINNDIEDFNKLVNYIKQETRKHFESALIYQFEGLIRLERNCSFSELEI